MRFDSKIKTVFLLSLVFSLLMIIFWFVFVVFQGRGPDDNVTCLLTLFLLPGFKVASLIKDYLLNITILMWTFIFIVQVILFFILFTTIFYIGKIFLRRLDKEKSD